MGEPYIRCYCPSTRGTNIEQHTEECRLRQRLEAAEARCRELEGKVDAAFATLEKADEWQEEANNQIAELEAENEKLKTIVDSMKQLAEARIKRLRRLVNAQSDYAMLDNFDSFSKEETEARLREQEAAEADCEKHGDLEE